MPRIALPAVIPNKSIHKQRFHIINHTNLFYAHSYIIYNNYKPYIVI